MLLRTFFPRIFCFICVRLFLCAVSRGNFANKMMNMFVVAMLDYTMTTVKAGLRDLIALSWQFVSRLYHGVIIPWVSGALPPAGCLPHIFSNY